MDLEPEKTNSSSSTFHKKVYSKLNSSPLSQSISSHSISSRDNESSPKKIIPSSATGGLREEFKKTFLPLLIDVFELRQMIDNYKSEAQSQSPISLGKVSQTPQEVLSRLEQLQHDVEESQRWCEGVILQISKGIEEAKEALALLDEEKTQKEKTGLLKTIFKKIIK